MLSFQERIYVRLLYRDKMAELHTTAFEDFFQKLMCLRYPDFLDVRTHGNIGDLSADGLLLYDGKLFACYAPEVFDSAYASKVKAKFHSDLANACAKRPGEFNIFVFVHNDLRGIHPEVTRLLSRARMAHHTLEFHQMGPRHLLGELYHLVRHEIEDLLGAEIMINELVYGIGLDDLRPLLEHLIERRRHSGAASPAGEVSGLKMDYNRLDEDCREYLRAGMRHTFLIEEYYEGIDDVTERDEVAADFSAFYRSTAQEYDAPDDIFRRLQEYVAGNERSTLSMEMALWVVLAYFFERCDIFREPPSGWLSLDRRLVTA